jgi:hypothetical protein
MTDFFSSMLNTVKQPERRKTFLTLLSVTSLHSKDGACPSSCPQARVQVLTTVLLKIHVLWNVAPS